MTGLAHRLALAIDMLDRPNERSSHSQVTPRGGGIAIVAVLLPTTVAFTAFGAIPVRLGAALAGGGALVAIIGWLDDRRGLPARLRAAVQAAAAAWALAWLGGFPTLNYGLGVLPLGPFGSLLAFAGIIWMINLYNFMDGIDGLAASEAIMTAGVAGILILAGGQPGLAVIVWTLAAATAGFLIWNWAPAQIFMGDVGSGFLGYTFATLAIFTENQGSLPLLVWITLLALFIVDATATLLRRIGLGERWYEAHRSHAYQRAVQAGLSHSQVTLAIVAIDGILGGLGYLGWRSPVTLLATLIVIVCTLMLLWRYCLMLPNRTPSSPGKERRFNNSTV